MPKYNVYMGKETGYSDVIHLIKGDKRTAIIRMAIKRRNNGVDLEGLAWKINVVNAAGQEDVYTPSAVVKDDNGIYVEWMPKGIATAAEGYTRYQLVGLGNDAAGEQMECWFAEKRISVGPSFDAQISDEQEEAASALDEMIKTVQLELPTVYAARDAANAAAEAANDSANTANRAAEGANAAADIANTAAEKADAAANSANVAAQKTETAVSNAASATSNANSAAAKANAAADNVKDGVSATHSWNGTILTVTSASGTSSANLKGDDGYTPVKGKDYFDGQDNVYIGTEEPTDPNVKVWINPDGDAVEIPLLSQFELINSVTLTEDVGEIVFDGFELEAATAFFTLEASTAADGYVSFKPSASKAGINGTVTNMRRTEKRYSRASYENKNGLSYAYFSVSASGANNVSSVSGAGIFKSFGNCGYFKAYLANSQLIPAGSIIELWGIRA